MFRLSCFPLFLCFAALAVAQQPEVKQGHSRHGSAYDSGLRGRPHLMKGTGSTPFKISAKTPEVQAYFDQANALMHSFWWEEAERSLRWCIKLDPDCAMAYLALARVGNGPIDQTGRYRDFLNAAIKRKYNVTERERMYIEAFEEAYAKDVKDSELILRQKLQAIVLKYPDDVEAKAMVAWIKPRPGEEYLRNLLVAEIQKVNPAHPGAVHLTIHNWDYKEPIQAIKSATSYSKYAPGIGHALHMPGHIFSKIGMWHEAARAMDSATRTELKYMNDRLALPFETWNFQHNRNYLSFIQEQLGMAELSLQGARDLLSAPTDPAGSNKAGGGLVYEGRAALIRGCLKFERYDDLLKPGALPYDDDEMDQMYRHWTETQAWAGKGNGPEARKSYEAFAGILRKRATADNKKVSMDRPSQTDDTWDDELPELEAQVLLAEGKIDEGGKVLLEAAEIERKQRITEPIAGDPPDVAWSVARILGDFQMKQGEPLKAIESYERALQYEPNCGFALSGLALAHHAAGHLDKAKEYAGRLEYVWSGADPGLRWLTAVRALKLDAKPIAVTPQPERPYRPAELKHYGPSNWTPFPAPALTTLNVNGKQINLADYRGKNILLVFYLGESCVHCVEQLAKINGRMSDFEKENTVVLGVSSTAPEANKESLKLGAMKIKLLSDKNHENARRFASYDDFEEMELHSTILIDAQGRIRWKRTGGDPFMDMDYLLRELRHIRTTR
ncbi:MAG: redoxin domain-containing protein [Fimbriimonas sp.]